MERVDRAGWKRSLATAVTGALVWSAWAAFVNGRHGVEAWLPAAATQAVLAFLIAFFMTAAVEFLVRLARRAWVSFVLAVGGTFAVIVPATLLGHTLAGTPELLATVTPPWLIGLVFCSMYTLGALRARRTGRHEES